MMDVYIEELMPKRKDRADWQFIIGLILSGILVTGLIIWFIAYMAFIVKNVFTQFAISLGPLAVAGVWYGVYHLLSSRSVEYEYIVINSSLDIDKIMGKKKRKRLISLDIKNATLMAKLDDNEENGYLNTLSSKVKVYNYSALNKNMDTYFIDAVCEGQRCIIIFQPTTKMVEGLWKFNPKAVKKYTL